MRIANLFVMSVFAAASLTACGDDGGGSGIIDAGIDAKVFMDAAADAPNAPAQGLGKVCDNMNPCPTTGGFVCTALSQTATHGFCTIPCGTTAPTAMMPPANGNMICMNSQPPPGAGTPACALTGAEMNNMKPWSCAVLCGMAGTTNLGSCPGGLVCMDNVCQ